MTNGNQKGQVRGIAILVGVAGLAAGGLWSTDVGATSPIVDLARYHGVEILAPEEMGGLRGGFITALGVPINFGVEILTTIDEEPIFQTSFVLTDSGFVSSVFFIPGDRILDLTTETSVELDNGTVVELVGGDTNVSLETVWPTGADLSGLDGSAGFVVVDGTQATAILHDVSTGLLSNVIVNTASHQRVEQHFEATISLSNIGDFQRDMRFEQLRMALDRF